MATDQYKPPSLLDYNRFGNDTPNWAANLAPVNQAPKPQPKVLAVLPTKPIANTAAQPVTTLPAANVQPLLGQKPNILPDVNAPSVTQKISSAFTQGNAAPAPRPSGDGYSPAGYKINPEYNIGNANKGGGIVQFMQDRFSGEGMHYTPQGWEKNAPKAAPVQAAASAAPTPAQPKAPTLGGNPLSQDQLNSLLPVTKLAGDLNSNPLPDSNPISKMAQQNTTGKAKPAGNSNTKPAKQTPAVAPAFDGADPYAAYKARTGIDLSNVSHAPVPSYVQQVNQTQGMDFVNGKPANADGSPVVPVESQEQFNQRWAQIQDFYNSPEGQAVINARNQGGDVVEVQRGDNISYTDLRNGGTKGIQDYIANEAAKDSALAKSPTDKMNNRELSALKLVEPKLDADTELAKANIQEAGANNRHDWDKQKMSAIQLEIAQGLTSDDPARVAAALTAQKNLEAMIAPEYGAIGLNKYDAAGMPAGEELYQYQKSGRREQPIAQPGQQDKPSAAHISALKANPSLKAQFDSKYGKGAADSILGVK